MGQVMRIATYDRAENEKNAISALQVADVSLRWFRLDDGVMGGKSETNHEIKNSNILHFTGTINTDGGGFASIRARLPVGLLVPQTEPTTSAAGLKLQVRGDGKTYKLFLTNGRTAGPMARNTPSWQVDVPTTVQCGDDEWQEVIVSFDEVRPSFGGGPRWQPAEEERNALTFDLREMNELGVMLSLKLSDGRPNPKETFGEGVFPFSLLIQSVELMPG